MPEDAVKWSSVQRGPNDGGAGTFDHMSDTVSKIGRAGCGIMNGRPRPENEPNCDQGRRFSVNLRPVA